jgi:hypothetical protein
MLSSTHLARQAFSNTPFAHQTSEDFTQLIPGKGEMANVTPAIQTSALRLSP